MISHRGRAKVGAVAVALMLAMSVGALAWTSAPALADTDDPKVRLQGRADCGTAGPLNRLHIRGANGESGWASLGSGGRTRSYRYTFFQVPASGMWVRATAYCTDGSEYDRLYLRRPRIGRAATVNLCFFKPDWVPCIL